MEPLLEFYTNLSYPIQANSTQSSNGQPSYNPLVIYYDITGAAKYMADDNVIDVREGNETSLHCPARLSFFRDCFKSCKTSRIPYIGILRHMSVKDIFGAAIKPT